MLTSQEVANKYAISWAIINADAGLKRWFNDFAQRYVQSNGQITQAEFQLELEAQPFWRQHSATWIQDMQLELEHPKDYEQVLGADIATLHAKAMEMGANVSGDALRSLAQNARRFGWNDAQQRSALAEYVTATADQNGRLDYEGLAGSAQDELMLWAKKNGVTLTNDLLSGYVRGVADGSTTIDEIKSDLRRTYMAGAYPAWADKINAGFDIADLAAPYQQAVQGLLEDNSIGLDDPMMKSLMQGVDAQGQPRVVPLYEAERMVRSDPRWQKTDNAYATYANVAQNLLRTFGFA